MSTDVDVVVAGAGLAGLTAARDLAAAGLAVLVLEARDRYFGPRAARPAGFVELDWQRERWTGGCYGTLFGPNVWTRYGYALRQPAGPVHWAGTETATAWCGYMDGAVRSGERAAAEVTAALAGPG
jgi:monoamine oxidase